MKPNEERFNDLYQNNRVALLNYFLRRTSDREQAADCLAQTFLTTWRRIADVPRGDEGRLWLYGVARRVRSDARRGATRHERLINRITAAIPGSSIRVVSDVDNWNSDAIERVLGELSVQDREIILLNVWEELSPTEIAEVLEMNANTVRTRLFRARSMMKESLSSSLSEVL